MGLMTGAGCASRVLGPVFVSMIYTRFGTYHTFGITGVMLLASMVWLQIVNNRLVPPTIINRDNIGEEQKQDTAIPLVHTKSDIEEINETHKCDTIISYDKK